MASGPPLANVTLRTVLRPTAGGDRMRLRLTNQYGRTELKVGAARVADASASKEVSFAGRPGVTLLPGMTITSDSVAFRTYSERDLAVSIYYPEPVPQVMTLHADILKTGERNTFTPGNTVHELTPTRTAMPLEGTYFLAGVDVAAEAARASIVVLGDSIADGGAQRWPTLLAERLSRSGKCYGVLNAAMSGNRVLREDRGFWGIMPSALDRFDRDVLKQCGVRYVILHTGINDIINTRQEPSERVTAAALMAGIAELAARAHRHGIKLYAGTLTPFEGLAAPLYSPEQDAVRTEVNAWIRSTTGIDGYIDFDGALADPQRPSRMRPDLDSGDHLHPNDAGERTLSEAVNLLMFE